MSASRPPTGDDTEAIPASGEAQRVRDGAAPPIDRRSAIDAEHVLCVRPGHGANCSSIGSVVDALFASAAVGAAIFAAVVAALENEDVTFAGPPPHDKTPATDPEPGA